jgi:hypothetical protein
MLKQERKYRHKVTLKCIRLTTAAVKKQIIITYIHCVAVASVIQHAKRMFRIILSSVTCLAVSVLGLPLLSFKQHDYRKNIFDHELCFSIFSTKSSAQFFILRRIQRNISYKVPVSIFRL